MTSAMLSFASVLLIANSSFALTPEALLAEHKSLVETLRLGGNTVSTQACADLAALSQNSAHHLKAEAQIQQLAFCDKNIQVDPFAAPAIVKIGQTFPWLQVSIQEMRTKRLLLFTKAQIDSTPALKSVPMYLNAAEAEQNRDEKIQLVLKIDHILKAASTQANANLRALIFRLVPRYLLKPRTNELVTVVNDHMKHGEVLPARRIIEAHLKASPQINAVNFNLLKILRDSYIGDDPNRSVFLTLSDKAVTWAAQFGEQELYLARLRQAKNITFRTEADLALEKLNILLRMKITNVQKAEVYLLIGKVYEQNLNIPEAIKANETAVSMGISGELLNRTQFDVGRMYWKNKNFAGAARTFLAYRNRFPNLGSDRAKGTFWLSRAYVKLGRQAEATTLLGEAKSMDKYGYYGIISARELKTNVTAQDLFTPLALQQYQEKVKKLSTVDPAHAGAPTLALLQTSKLPKAPAATHSYFLDLLKADQVDIFINAAVYFVNGLSPAKEADVDVAQLYLEALQYVGQYTASFAFSGKLGGALRLKILKESPSLFFPAGYISSVSSHSKSRGIDVSLILSIIKQESGFNAGVRSPVGAIGLMQLMPQTAAAIATAKGIKNFDPKTLFTPAVNIDFGTYLVDDLAASFSNRFTAVVGAYNGGKYNVEKWIRYSTAADEVEFVEDIPFIETRNYIKAVAKNMTVYGALLNPANRDPFPY